MPLVARTNNRGGWKVHPNGWLQVTVRLWVMAAPDCAGAKARGRVVQPGRSS